MKQIQINLEDSEYERLSIPKEASNLTWKEFIMQLAEGEA